MKNNQNNEIDLLSVIDDYKSAPIQKKQRFKATQTAAAERQIKESNAHITEIDGTAVSELPRSISAHFETDTLSEETLTSHFFTDSETERTKKAAAQQDAEPSRAAEAAGKAASGFLGASAFVLKLVTYIAVVLIVSAYAAYYAISVANDVFAFVKSPAECTINVTSTTTPDAVATILENEGVIRYADIFRLFMTYQADGKEIKLIEGEHKLKGEMNYSQIYSALTVETVQRTVVRVTIPEGLTTDEIIDLLVESGIGERENYVEAINNYPYKHEFVQLLDSMTLPENRTYRLDGYLFPDTYDFYNDLDEYLVINKLLNNFDTKFWKDYKKLYKETLDEKGMTFDDLVTLASIVQSEGKQALEYEYIAYVFYNRLDAPKTFPNLQSDATVNYILSLSGAHHEDLTQDDLDLNHPYNTYINSGLTPGAISNPGLDALIGTVYPTKPLSESNKEIDAYYFISSKLGNTYYAETYSAHLKNKKTVEAENKQYEQSQTDAGE